MGNPLISQPHAAAAVKGHHCKYDLRAFLPLLSYRLLLGGLSILLNGWGSSVLLAGIGKAGQILHIHLIGSQPCPATTILLEEGVKNRPPGQH